MTALQTSAKPSPRRRSAIRHSVHGLGQREGPMLKAASMVETRDMYGKALLAALLVAWSFPAQAAWQEYVYPELGVAKDFPVEPKKTEGTWGQGIRLPL